MPDLELISSFDLYIPLMIEVVRFFVLLSSDSVGLPTFVWQLGSRGYCVCLVVPYQLTLFLYQSKIKF